MRIIRFFCHMGLIGSLVLSIGIGCSSKKIVAPTDGPPIDAPDENPPASCTPIACADVGKNCGSISDQCGGILDCGRCESGNCGGGGVDNVCGSGGQCLAETDAAFCARLGKNCGEVNAWDTCGRARTTDCGICGAQQTCGGEALKNVCLCRSSADCDGDNVRTDQDCDPNDPMIGKGRRPVHISVGSTHACALDEFGVAYCWGHGRYGQLGRGPLVTQSDARPVLDMPEKLVQLTAGLSQSCGLTESGKAYCWGNGTRGTATVTAPFRPLPVDQSTSGDFQSIDAEGNYVCGLRVDGQTYCWGQFLYTGSVAPEPFPTSYLRAPKAIDQSHSGPFSKIAVGTFHACGLNMNGQAYCWGYNGLGHLGNGSLQSTLVLSAVDQSSSGAFVNIDVGTSIACGLTSAGQIYCWGDNGFGSLGTGTLTMSNAPVAVTQPGLVFDALYLGGHSACATTQTQTYCWGENTSGQLGLNSDRPTLVPTRFYLPNIRFESISLYSSVSCGITHDKGMYCWGIDDYGIRWPLLVDSLYGRKGYLPVLEYDALCPARP